MNCPVCNRNNAVTLSVCPSCGTMIGDSRADLLNKVYPSAKTIETETKTNSSSLNNAPKSVKNAASTEETAADGVSPVTTSISTKLTSPTLVEFHSANATVPEWRLQLQNTVRQRGERALNGSANSSASAATAPSSRTPSRQPNLVTKGATALKIETLEEVSKPSSLGSAQTDNPKLASALERIKNSRQKFLVEEEEQPAAAIATPEPIPAKTNKHYPFYIAAKTNEADVKTAAAVNSTATVVKPKLATSLRIETKELDTNKLPPLPAKIATSFETESTISITQKTAIEETIVEEKKLEIEPVKNEAVVASPAETEEIEIEESEDFAPFAMRFNAGLFDLIIGSFLSLILLAPFILMSEGWMSFTGVFAFLATCAVVMFAYLTTTISMHGKTLGMRLFSLELIDAENEDYPTLHQSAVNSAVYLLSLAFCGAGFLTLFFNEDQRALHDIVAGTIIVKEI